LGAQSLYSLGAHISPWPIPEQGDISMTIAHSDIIRHPQYFTTIGQIAECARKRLPEANGRLVKAVEIALSGGVQPSALVKGAWRVASQSGGDGYEVVEDACTCPDYQQRQPADPEMVCKHILASWLYRRTVQRLTEIDAQAPAMCWMPVDMDGTPCSASGSACTHHQQDALEPSVPDVLRRHIVTIHGQPFVRYAGLLALAHQHELQSLVVELISVSPELAVARATATFQNGMVFTEIGDATPENISARVRPHFIRMAATRAKTRALRDALGIDLCSFEELAD
jgi:hypothetical protein